MAQSSDRQMASRCRACRGHYWLTLYLVKTAAASCQPSNAFGPWVLHAAQLLQHLRGDSAILAADGKACPSSDASCCAEVHIEGRGSFKPWLRREHEERRGRFPMLSSGFQSRLMRRTLRWSSKTCVLGPEIVI